LTVESVERNLSAAEELVDLGDRLDADDERVDDSRLELEAEARLG
jgi:hypothetical protein